MCSTGKSSEIEAIEIKGKLFSSLFSSSLFCEWGEMWILSRGQGHTYHSKTLAHVTAHMAATWLCLNGHMMRFRLILLESIPECWCEVRNTVCYKQHWRRHSFSSVLPVLFLHSLLIQYTDWGHILCHDGNIITIFLAFTLGLTCPSTKQST